MAQEKPAFKVYVFHSYLAIDENGIPRRLHKLDNKTIEAARVRGWAIFQIEGDEVTILGGNGEWSAVEWEDEVGMANEAVDPEESVPSIKLFDECPERPD